MTAVPEILLRPEALRREILRRGERVETLRRLAGRMTPRLSPVRVRTSPDPGRLQALLDDAADEEREILRLEQELDEAVQDTALFISALPDRRMALLLELRYLDGRGWPEIAELLHYSESWTFKLHLRALSLLPGGPPAPDAP